MTTPISPPSVDSLIATLKSKKYSVFENDNLPYNLNIVGIRNKSDSPEKFDDLLCVFYKFQSTWNYNCWPITTDPSKKYLLKPINRKGTAILKENQYRNIYAVRQHTPRGKKGYTALCQEYGPVVVYRDNTKDGNLNYVNPDSGNFGINIHKGPNNGNWDERNTNYSAGCQVFANRKNFSFFMNLCNESRKRFGNMFTYTLINECDLL